MLLPTRRENRGLTTAPAHSTAWVHMSRYVTRHIWNEKDGVWDGSCGFLVWELCFKLVNLLSRSCHSVLFFHCTAAVGLRVDVCTDARLPSCMCIYHTIKADHHVGEFIRCFY